MKTEKLSKLKTAVIILSVLLALSVIALVGVAVYNKMSVNTDTTVAVPDNLITPDKADTESSETGISESGTSSLSSELSRPNDSTVSKTYSSVGEKIASKVSLYAKHPDDNESFSLKNAFPGDSVAKSFCVQVSYKGTVTVHYNAKLRDGDGMLSEALNLHIKMLNDGSVLYDGPITDMPTSVTYELTSEKETTSELYYEISAYIPETVGNEYQSKSIVVDFFWWAEETENLIPAPGTGDGSNILLFAIVGFAALCVLIVLAVVPKGKEDSENA